MFIPSIDHSLISIDCNFQVIVLYN